MDSQNILVNSFVGIVILYFTFVVAVFTPAIVESIKNFIHRRHFRTLRDERLAGDYDHDLRKRPPKI